MDGGARPIGRRRARWGARDDRRRGETRAKDARRDRDARETEGAADAREGRRWGFRIGPGAALRARGKTREGRRAREARARREVGRRAMGREREVRDGTREAVETVDGERRAMWETDEADDDDARAGHAGDEAASGEV